MLTLNDGRSELWQWDTGRTLAVDADCSQVHFSNKVFGRSIDVDVNDGFAIIPDILLQTDKDLNVWAFVGTAENGYTKISKTFKINRRNKPADYVFTPVEQTTIAEIAAIAQSVRDDADAGLFDGRDGVDGYTPTNGVDYGTPEQISEIAQYAAEILQPEVEKLKGDLSNKIDKPATAPEVGKILKVTAVNEDGTFTCEWADAPSGGGAVNDVHINGTSIVADGVANIPKATTSSLGLIRMSNGGIRFSGTGAPYIYNTGKNGVDARVVDSALLLNEYDYAVKCAMTDGKGAAWTDAERIAALLRMGCTVDDNGFVKWTSQEVVE